MDKLREFDAVPEGHVAYNEGLIDYMCGRAGENGADEALVTEIRDALTADYVLTEAAGKLEWEKFMAEYRAGFGEDEPS